jgi:hypothetical protein
MGKHDYVWSAPLAVWLEEKGGGLINLVSVVRFQPWPVYGDNRHWCIVATIPHVGKLTLSDACVGSPWDSQRECGEALRKLLSGWLEAK